MEAAASRQVSIFYGFPWGQKPIETLSLRGDAELLQRLQGEGCRLQVSRLHALLLPGAPPVLITRLLQARDGGRAAPHVVSATGNVDLGMMAFLSNSLQELSTDGKHGLQQRKVGSRFFF